MAKHPIRRETLCMLFPLTLLLCIMVMVLAFSANVASHLGRTSLEGTAESATSQVNMFFFRQLEIYNMIRKWVLTDVIGPIDISSYIDGSDIRVQQYEFFFYSLLQEEDSILAFYFAGNNHQVVKVHQEVTDYYSLQTRWYVNETVQLRRERYHPWTNYDDVSYSEWQEKSYDPVSMPWWVLGNQTRASTSLDWSIFDASDYGQYFRWNGPEFQTTNALGSILLPAMVMFFRVDFPNFPGQWGVFKLKFLTSIFDELFSQLPIVAEDIGSVCTVHMKLLDEFFVILILDGRVVNMKNLSDHVVDYENGTRAFRRIWDLDDTCLNRIEEADLLDPSLDEGESLSLLRGGFLIGIYPLDLVPEWRMCVCIPFGAALGGKVSVTLLFVVEALSAVAVIIVSGRGVYAVAYIIRKRRNQLLSQQRGKKLRSDGIVEMEDVDEDVVDDLKTKQV